MVERVRKEESCHALKRKRNLEKKKKIGKQHQTFFPRHEFESRRQKTDFEPWFFSLLVDAFMIESFCFFGMLPQSFFSCHNAE